MEYFKEGDKASLNKTSNFVMQKALCVTSTKRQREEQIENLR